MVPVRVGQKGEELAKLYLVNRGFKVVCENWRCFEGEIDLICAHNGVTHFIEVKYRTRANAEDGIYAISPHKRYKLRRAIFNYVSQFKVGIWQFDVVSIVGSRLRYYPQVWL